MTIWDFFCGFVTKSVCSEFLEIIGSFFVFFSMAGRRGVWRNTNGSTKFIGNKTQRVPMTIFAEICNDFSRIDGATRTFFVRENPKCAQMAVHWERTVIIAIKHVRPSITQEPHNLQVSIYSSNQQGRPNVLIAVRSACSWVHENLNEIVTSRDGD